MCMGSTRRQVCQMGGVWAGCRGRIGALNKPSACLCVCCNLHSQPLHPYTPAPLHPAPMCPVSEMQRTGDTLSHRKNLKNLLDVLTFLAYCSSRLEPRHTMCDSA